MGTATTSVNPGFPNAHGLRPVETHAESRVVVVWWMYFCKMKDTTGETSSSGNFSLLFYRFSVRVGVLAIFSRAVPAFRAGCLPEVRSGSEAMQKKKALRRLGAGSVRLG